jgi:hypothetical protein
LEFVCKGKWSTLCVCENDRKLPKKILIFRVFCGRIIGVGGRMDKGIDFLNLSVKCEREESIFFYDSEEAKNI